IYVGDVALEVVGENAEAVGAYRGRVEAIAVTRVNVVVMNAVGAVVTLSVNAGTTPQSATISTAFANALAVTVKDAGSNPVSGVKDRKSAAEGVRSVEG